MKKIKFSWATFLCCILITMPNTIYSQTSNLEMQLMMKAEFDSLAIGSHKVNDYYFNATNERYFIDFLRTYENSSSISVRSRILALKYKIGQQSKDSLIRQIIVFELLSNLNSNEASIKQYILTRIIEFKEHDFSDKARAAIEYQFGALHDNMNYLLVCGIAQCKNLIPALQKMAGNFERSKNAWFSDPSWFAQIALARMRPLVKIDTLVAAVELESSAVLRITRLLRYVAYTKHPDAIRLLKNYLESSDILPNVKETGPPIGVNQYAMDFLATYIENFPVKARGGNYSNDEIKLGIAFLNKTGTF